MQSNRAKQAMELANQLREVCPSHVKVDIPGIGVFGEQSAGKSSLLHGITGISFPEGQEMTTRTITQVNMKPGEEFACAIKLVPRLQDDEIATIVTEFPAELQSAASLDEIGPTIAAATAYLASKFGSEKAIYSEITITISLVQPGSDFISICDVPGIFSNVSEVATEADRRGVEALVRSVMAKKEMLLVCVHDASSDLANASVLNLAREYDQKQRRTIGVLSKADKLNHDVQAKGIALERLKNDTVHSLLYGYYLTQTMNAETLDHLDKVSERRLLRDNWAAEINEYPDIVDRLGIHKLVVKLAAINEELVREYYPVWEAQIATAIDESTDNLKKLGEPIGTERQRFQVVESLLRAIGEEFAVLHEGGSSPVCIEIAEGNGIAEVHGDQGDMVDSLVHDFGFRFCAWQAWWSRSFATRMRVAGLVERIDDDLVLVKPLVPEESDDDASASAQALANVEEYESRTAKARKLREELKARIIRCRDQTLPIFLSPRIFNSLFERTLEVWKNIASTFFNAAAEGMRRSLDRIVKWVMEQKQVLNEQYPAAQKVLAKHMLAVWKSETTHGRTLLEQYFETELIPHTLNADLGKRFDELKQHPIKMWIDSMSHGRPEEAIRVPAAVLEKVVRNNGYEHEIDALDREAIQLNSALDAYQSVAVNALIDKVPEIATQVARNIITALQHSNYDDVSWAGVFNESPAATARRERLQANLATLEDMYKLVIDFLQYTS